MRKLKRSGNLIPVWEMPSDPVKAVFWFIHWFLSIVVRFFWILILAAVFYESLVNRVIGGVVTLLVGLVVWLGLAIVLYSFSAAARISRTVEDVGRMQQRFSSTRSFDAFSNARPDIDDSKIVEGSVTDLEEERKKRRRE